ncbi:MAG: AAA family ATPase [Candidatus Lokiarchaeota archaeon]|nr:AAA family ATPase [Candidatus Lokiarchaeota archaeon]
MKLKPPRGILLRGPPGTGKTLIAKAEATMAGLYPVTIDGASIMSKFYGESEKRLRDKFLEAIENTPSLIIIDELDALAPKRSEHGGRAEIRVVAQLLTLMDGIHKSDDDVIVLGTTNRVNAIDPALRRPGRFEIEIEIGVPNEEGRRKILDIHLRETPMADVNIKEIARETHGYVGADLAGLISRAKYKAIREVVPDIDEKIEITPELLQVLNLKQTHLEHGITETQPSAMREILAEVPKVRWNEIGGLSEEVSKIKEVIISPLTKGEKFDEMGVKPPSGILLYGPPGCGKTLIAKAVATESKANFISIKGPELRSKWVGESEKGIRMIFAKAIQVAPCVIYFDECESIGRSRGTITNDSGVGENMLSQLLTEMDGLEGRENIVVIMATNRPDILDHALMRRGRLDRHIYIGHPSTDKEKRKIFDIHTKPMKIADDIKVDRLISMMENFSGSDIYSICQEAGMLAIKNDDEIIRMKHFEEILKDTKGSITPQMIQYYTKIREILTSKKMRIDDSEWAKKYI